VNIKITNSQYKRLNEDISDKTVNKIVTDLLKKYYVISSDLGSPVIYNKLTDEYIQRNDIQDYIGDRVGDSWKNISPIYNTFIDTGLKNRTSKLTEEISDRTINKIVNDLLKKYYAVGSIDDVSSASIYKRLTYEYISFNDILDYVENRIGEDKNESIKILRIFLETALKEKPPKLNENVSDKNISKIVNKLLDRYSFVPDTHTLQNVRYYKDKKTNKIVHGDIIVDYIEDIVGWNDKVKEIYGMFFNISKNNYYDNLNENVSDRTVDRIVNKLLKIYHYKDGTLKFKDTDTTLDPVDALDLVNKIKDLIGDNKTDFEKVIDKFHSAYHNEKKLNEQLVDINKKIKDNMIDYMINNFGYPDKTDNKDSTPKFKYLSNNELFTPRELFTFILDRVGYEYIAEDVYHEFLKNLKKNQFKKINENVSDNTIDKIADKIIKKFYSKSSKLEGTEKLIAIHNYVEDRFGSDYLSEMDKIYNNIVQKIKPY